MDSGTSREKRVSQERNKMIKSGLEPRPLIWSSLFYLSVSKRAVIDQWASRMLLYGPLYSKICFNRNLSPHYVEVRCWRGEARSSAVRWVQRAKISRESGITVVVIFDADFKSHNRQEKACAYFLWETLHSNSEQILCFVLLPFTVGVRHPISIHSW